MDPGQADLKLIEAAKLVSKPDAVQEDADRAVSMFTEVADAGFAGGMFGLAELKMSGRWVARDVEGAVALYEKAAGKGNVPAMFRVANIYVQDGEHSDAERAFGYLKKCADAGFPPAFGCLGDMYYYGIGTAVDPVRAADQYMRAARHGDAESMFKLGCMYEAGSGVEKDGKRSRAMFFAAAQGGLAEAQFKTASMIYDGEVPGGRAEAAKWYALCADRIPIAKFNLATMYFRGDGVGKDLPRAFSMYRELADSGDADAIMQVGRMFLDGEGVERNAEEAFRYIAMAAKAGNAEAVMLTEGFRRRQNAQIVHIDGADERRCGTEKK